MLWEHDDGRTIFISNPKQKDYKPKTLNNVLKILNEK
ncbi:TPA: hypothetical protein ACGO1N_001925 [Streptococcus suis]